MGSDPTRATKLTQLNLQIFQQPSDQFGARAQTFQHQQNYQLAQKQFQQSPQVI